MNPLPKFSKNCPKCDSDDLTSSYGYRYKSDKEHLARECKSCGYSWWSQTKENTSKYYTEPLEQFKDNQNKKGYI